MERVNRIRRYPLRKGESLQAWGSADDLILEHLGSIDLSGKRILILNDSFGALGCGLLSHDVTSYVDSFLGYQGALMNSCGKIAPVNQLTDLIGKYDFILIKIPKNMSFFEDELAYLSGHLHEGSKIICGAMVKHLAKASFDLIQKYVGATTTSLAKKKARLIFADFQKNKAPSPYPLQVTIEGFEKPFTHHSNLFSREKLDIGTRFLLENLPVGNFQKIVDLGCANGIVGIRAKSLNPAAHLIFSDESFMAVQSARANYEKYFMDEAEFLWLNCLEGRTPGDVDLVICNPPFHQENAVGDSTAVQMFFDSHKVLKPGGLLRVIGNSHLRYDVKLKKIFKNARVLATNQKFMIVDSVK